MMVSVYAYLVTFSPLNALSIFLSEGEKHVTLLLKRLQRRSFSYAFS